MTYSFNFKSLPSLPNQRYHNPLVMPINPLGMLSHFVISTSLCVTRNIIWSIVRDPLKSPVPNLTALCTVQSHLLLLHSLPSSHSAALLLCTLVYLRISYEPFLHFLNTLTSPFHNTVFQPWGTISRVVELENFISWIWFSLLSASQSQWPRGLRRGSAAAHLLGLRVRIPQERWMFVSVSITYFHVEVPASDWSLVQRSPT